MEKVVKIIKQKDESNSNNQYWLSATVEERLSTIQVLREQHITLFNKQDLYNESRERLLRTDGFPVEFVELLNEQKVKYLVVGAYALALYAEPRNTGDIDFFC